MFMGILLGQLFKQALKGVGKRTNKEVHFVYWADVITCLAKDSCSDIIDIRTNNFLVYLQNSEDTNLPNPDRQLSHHTNH
jgi:hypothetical protein